MDEIMQWTNDFGKPNVLWIHGYPGAGKSTIASTVAEELRRSHRLGAIFAFDRKAGTNLSVLWRMIAYRLACEYPVCRSHIVSKLKEHILDNATATDIFTELVVEALQLCDRLPVLIVDALDECGGLGAPGMRDRQVLLSHIVDWAKLSSHFKLIVTSRLEGDIERALQKICVPLPIPTGRNVSADSTHDIRLYLEVGFKQIVQAAGLPQDWPGQDAVADLTTRSAGIFVWAATVLNYITRFPRTRLTEVQKGSLPPGDVYALYRQIMENAFGECDDGECERAVALLGAMIVSQLPFTPTDFESLLEMDSDTMMSICSELRPVLDSGETLRFAHQSFVDFLIGHQSSNLAKDKLPHAGKFHIDVTAAHIYLLECSFRLMNTRLRFNICNIESSFLPNSALSQSRVDEAIPPSLAYACRFWGFHLEHMTQGVDLSLITTFMRETLLFWLEALSALNAVNVAARTLSLLLRRLESGSNQMVSTASRFYNEERHRVSISRVHMWTKSRLLSKTRSSSSDISHRQ